MAKPNQWNIKPSDLFRKVLEARTKRLVTVYAFTFLESLDYLSPRRTGLYVSNHRYAVGSPDLSVADDTDGVQYPGNYISQPYPTIYISNNLPYAEALENGTDTMDAQNIYGQAAERVKGIDPDKLR